MYSTIVPTPTPPLCGSGVLARLHELSGQPVEVVTVRMRYRGRLLAVHPRAVWLEFSDDCRVAITEPVVTVAPRPDADADADAGATAHAHPTAHPP